MKKTITITKNSVKNNFLKIIKYSFLFSLLLVTSLLILNEIPLKRKPLNEEIPLENKIIKFNQNSKENKNYHIQNIFDTYKEQTLLKYLIKTFYQKKVNIVFSDEYATGTYVHPFNDNYIFYNKSEIGLSFFPIFSLDNIKEEEKYIILKKYTNFIFIHEYMHLYYHNKGKGSIIKSQNKEIQTLFNEMGADFWSAIIIYKVMKKEGKEDLFDDLLSIIKSHRSKESFNKTITHQTKLIISILENISKKDKIKLTLTQENLKRFSIFLDDLFNYEYKIKRDYFKSKNNNLIQFLDNSKDSKNDSNYYPLKSTQSDTKNFNLIDSLNKLIPSYKQYQYKKNQILNLKNNTSTPLINIMNNDKEFIEYISQQLIKKMNIS